MNVEASGEGSSSCSRSKAKPFKNIQDEGGRGHSDEHATRSIAKKSAAARIFDDYCIAKLELD